MSIDSAGQDVERRLRLLEDQEAIRRLKSLYGEYWDGGFAGSQGSGEKLAALFTEDATWDARPLPPEVLRGRDEIKECCDNLLRNITFDAAGERRELESIEFHLFANPRIDVDGDRAVATFTGLITACDPDTDSAYWCAGRYADHLVRTDEGWKFSALKFHHVFFTPYDGPGWIKRRFPEAVPA
jgi:hypothetical protein